MSAPWCPPPTPLPQQLEPGFHDNTLTENHQQELHNRPVPFGQQWHLPSMPPPHHLTPMAGHDMMMGHPMSHIQNQVSYHLGMHYAQQWHHWTSQQTGMWKPPPRKRGRPRGSKDVVPRARKVLMPKKIPPKSSPTSPGQQLDASSAKESASTIQDQGGTPTDGRSGDEVGAGALGSCEEEDDASSHDSRAHGTGSQGPASTERLSCLGDKLWYQEPPALVQCSWPLNYEMAALDVSLPHTDDHGQLELVDTTWLAHHEELFRKRKHDSY
jgi:hypothetical protein